MGLDLRNEDKKTTANNCQEKMQKPAVNYVSWLDPAGQYLIEIQQEKKNENSHSPCGKGQGSTGINDYCCNTRDQEDQGTLGYAPTNSVQLVEWNCPTDQQ